MQIIERAEKEGAVVGNWSPRRKRQFLTLTNPEHLGRFRVLVQERFEKNIPPGRGAKENKSPENIGNSGQIK